MILSAHIHKVDSGRHNSFLNEKRKDPYTKKIIAHGDSIVFCAVCKSAFLYDSWVALGSQHCHQARTESSFIDLEQTTVLLNRQTQLNRKTQVRPSRSPNRQSNSPSSFGAVASTITGVGLLTILGFWVVNIKWSATNTSVDVSISQASAESFVVQYYQDINNHQYQSAWNKLPSALQNDRGIHPNGYQSFVDFYKRLAGVQLTSSSVLEQDDSHAIVNADLKCEFKGGKTSSLFLRFHLIRNSDKKSWQLNKVKFDPHRKSSCGVDN
jgi:hypothetical protein